MLLLSMMNWLNLRTSRMTQSKFIHTHTHTLTHTCTHTQRINSVRKLLTWSLCLSPQRRCLQEIQQDWFLHQSGPSEGGGRRRHGLFQDPTRLPEPRGPHQAGRGGRRARRRGHLADAPRGAEAGTARSLSTNSPPFTVKNSPSVGFFELISVNCGIHLICWWFLILLADI